MIEPDAGPPVEARRRRVLLVEDDSAAGRGLSRLLEAQGFAVTVVSDGSSALAILRDDPSPDFLLTDLQLPDLDGREVARFARGLVPAPRVALITGWDLDLSSDQCAQLGIDWVLLKPLYVPDLVALLNQQRDPPATNE
ncbi:MAG: response regulator [Isosphaeraceae bacterium]|nr:response regulator [Isosphaeraceae bacterium]